MTYNYNLLKVHMKDKGITQKQLAKELDISYQRLSAILTKKGKFNVDLIIKCCNVLDIKKEQIGDYFFKVC